MLDLNQQQHARSIYRLHRFCRARTSKDYRSYGVDKNYYRKCQIYRKEVYSREPYKYEFRDEVDIKEAKSFGWIKKHAL